MFEFASGKINVLEKKVFDKLDQERMLAAPDFQRAFEVLYDTDLGEIATKKKEIEEILEEDFFNLKKIFSSILEDQNVILFLFLKFDASNLKLSLKKYKKEELKVPYLFWGTEPPQKIEKWAFVLARQKFAREKIEANPVVEKSRSHYGARLPDLNPQIKKLIFLALKFLKNLKSREIEIWVDKTYFKLKLALAQQIHPFLKDLTRTEIDLLNLKNLIRFENKKEGREFFIEGGNLNYPELLGISEFKEAKALKSSSVPREYFSFPSLKKFLETYQISHILKSYQETKSLINLEKEFQNLLSDQIFQKSRETSSGIEKILSFFQRKINAQHNIRLILFSKLNKITTEEIEDKLLLI